MKQPKGIDMITHPILLFSFFYSVIAWCCLCVSRYEDNCMMYKINAASTDAGFISSTGK